MKQLSKKGSLRSPSRRAQLLIKDPDFQKRVLQLRKKWNILPTGLGTVEQQQNWNRRLDQISDQYINSKAFQSKFAKIKKKLQTETIASYPYTQYKDDLASLNATIPINEYLSDLKTLRKDFELSGYWKELVKGYLIGNIMSDFPASTSIQVNLNLNDPSDREVSLTIWEHTRLQDITRVWRDLQIHQSKILGYRKYSKHPNPDIVDRNSFIVEKSRQGKKPKEISQLLYDEFGPFSKRNRDITEEDTEIYNLSQQNISTITYQSKKNKSK